MNLEEYLTESVKLARTCSVLITATPMSPLDTDLSLLDRFATLGDHAAFAEIVRRYAGVVFAACHRVLRDPARAEDVSQETFFRLMRKPQAVSQSLGAWLHAAATNLAIDSLRSDSARHRREQEHVKDLIDERETAAREVSTWSELSPHIDAALAELPEEFRSLLIAHFLQGRPQNEMAVEAKTSTATISRRIRAAVEALQQKMRRQGMSIAPLALMGFMHDHALQGVPMSLTAELGKMTMVSGARGMMNAAAASGKSALLQTAAAILGVCLAAGFIGAWIGGRHLRNGSPASHSVLKEIGDPADPFASLGRAIESTSS